MEFNLSINRPVQQICKDIHPISIPQTKKNSSEPRTLDKTLGLTCSNCELSQELHVCPACSFVIHTLCLGSSFNRCPNCNKLINYKEFYIRCEACLISFKGNQVKACLHKLCPACQPLNQECSFCFGFNLFPVFPTQAGDSSLIKPFFCKQCEVKMKVVGKKLLCEEHNYENCIGCKRNPHQDSCIRNENRKQIPCIRCKEVLENAEPSMFVNCKRCSLIYCYVCSNRVNAVSHVNCARIYASPY